MGKTALDGELTDIDQKHPHVRGEDDLIEDAKEAYMETPPRAWGRLAYRAEAKTHVGNTPTCVGKTF